MTAKYETLVPMIEAAEIFEMQGDDFAVSYTIDKIRSAAPYLQGVALDDMVTRIIEHERAAEAKALASHQQAAAARAAERRVLANMSAGRLAW